MDISLVLFGLATCAIVVYAFDRLGSMMPDSSWGGLYVNAERIWSWRQAGRSEEPLGPRDHIGSDPSNGEPTIESWDEPVPVIEEISGTGPRWLW